MSLNPSKKIETDFSAVGSSRSGHSLIGPVENQPEFYPQYNSVPTDILSKIHQVE